MASGTGAVYLESTSLFQHMCSTPSAQSTGGSACDEGEKLSVAPKRTFPEIEDRRWETTTATSKSEATGLLDHFSHNTVTSKTTPLNEERAGKSPATIFTSDLDVGYCPLRLPPESDTYVRDTTIDEFIPSPATSEQRLLSHRDLTNNPCAIGRREGVDGWHSEVTPHPAGQFSAETAAAFYDQLPTSERDGGPSGHHHTNFNSVFSTVSEFPLQFGYPTTFDSFTDMREIQEALLGMDAEPRQRPRTQKQSFSRVVTPSDVPEDREPKEAGEDTTTVSSDAVRNALGVARQSLELPPEFAQPSAYAAAASLSRLRAQELLLSLSRAQELLHSAHASLSAAYDHLSLNYQGFLATAEDSSDVVSTIASGIQAATSAINVLAPGYFDGTADITLCAEESFRRPMILAHPDEFKNPSSFLKIYGDPQCMYHSSDKANDALDVHHPRTGQDGNWECSKCHNVNYPRRFRCNNIKCRALRDVAGDKLVSDYTRHVFHWYLSESKNAADPTRHTTTRDAYLTPPRSAGKDRPTGSKPIRQAETGRSKTRSKPKNRHQQHGRPVARSNPQESECATNGSKSMSEVKELDKKFATRRKLGGVPSEHTRQRNVSQQSLHEPCPAFY